MDIEEDIVQYFIAAILTFLKSVESFEHIWIFAKPF